MEVQKEAASLGLAWEERCAGCASGEHWRRKRGKWPVTRARTPAGECLQAAGSDPTAAQPRPQPAAMGGFPRRIPSNHLSSTLTSWCGTGRQLPGANKPTDPVCLTFSMNTYLLLWNRATVKIHRTNPKTSVLFKKILGLILKLR